MIGAVKAALGPVFLPMAALWTVTAYFGLDMMWMLFRDKEAAAASAEGAAAKLHRLSTVAMVTGLFGQIFATATGLGAVKGAGGMAGISELIKLLSVSLWSTLAGISVALLAEAFLIIILWKLSGVEKEAQNATCETCKAVEVGTAGDTARAD